MIRKLIVGALVAVCFIFGSGPLTLDTFRGAHHDKSSVSRTGAGLASRPSNDDDFSQALITCTGNFTESRSHIFICMHERGYGVPYSAQSRFSIRPGMSELDWRLEAMRADLEYQREHERCEAERELAKRNGSGSLFSPAYCF